MEPESGAGVPADGDRLTPLARPFSLGGVQPMNVCTRA
jgi:hypothetical protein